MTYPKMWTKYSHLSYNSFLDQIGAKLDAHELAYLQQLEEAIDFHQEFGDSDSDPKALQEEIDRLSDIICDRDKEIDQLELIQAGLEEEVTYLSNKIDDLTDTIASLQEELNEIKDN